MEKVKYFISSIATAATGTSVNACGQAHQYMVYVPSVAATFTSTAVKMTLEGAYASGVSTKTCYFYDYVNKTPNECAATISTGGFYELPFPGSPDFVRVSFDVATTQAVQCTLITPKTTF